MPDLVNDFFRQHYPADFDTSWEMQHCVNQYGRKYTGEGGTSATIFPAMKCVGGNEMSVQGHFGAYSMPREDFADHYVAVEIASAAEPLLDAFKGDTYGEGEEAVTIYAYVPISIVEQVIEKHGGLVAYRAIEEAQRGA
jgi:hypothetical protein